MQKSNALSNTWDTNKEKKSTSCFLTDDNFQFDLTPLAGPYSIETQIDGIKKSLEVRFCNPAYINSGKGKSSLVYILEDDNIRAKRLTSGSPVMNSMKPLKRFSEEKDIDEVIGVYYEAVPNEVGEYCARASGLTPAKPYIVDFKVYCKIDGHQKDDLMYN